MKIIDASPLLRMFDEEATRAFDLDFLGFELDWEHRFEDALPLYMQVSLGGCRLHLTGHHGDCCPGSTVFIEVSDLRPYQQQLAARQYKHARPGCEETPWGTLEMSIADPSGNRIRFSQRLEEE